MAEGKTFIKCASGKFHDSIEAKVSFSEGSATFDMETYIWLQRQDLVANDNPVCKFIRRYGWSIKKLYLRSTFSDHLATLLDESLQERGSQIVNLEVTTFSLTKLGIDALDRTIKRSQRLASLKLDIWNLCQENVLKYAEILVALGGCLTNWKDIINAIDISLLDRLNFSNTNFSQKELTLSVDRIAEYASRSELTLLFILVSTDLQKDSPGTSVLHEKLRKVAPKVRVYL
ncbi:hypothetical protein BGZ65_008372 [Modicella reniformis]|uniref:Uncharacterized protein n=1 Tax=Modicella reniformis TaxID=1440133 RepID=A0A9P6MEZ4_9FUNG|nr:hypothetical protein BGZ65_008372 [Modicella reniformis]